MQQTQPTEDHSGLENAADHGLGADDELGSTPGSNSARELLRTLVEWLLVAVCALGLALLIRMFLVQAYYIPSSSMEETLRNDDRVLVNKLSYRFGDVERGDVIVFAKPDDALGDIKDFIKRVIALEGETISFSNGRVLIDGEALDEPYVDRPSTFVNGRLMNCANEPAAADYCLVPQGTVFVMGDNREGSTDSRTFGPIEIDSIVGRAFIKVWPLGDIGFL
ncbi:MAG: signal peptidase I [Acidimicrobiaceae bacterium]|nr:signal peptidase I [Acidimicrobiaceae bacterium]